MTTSLNELAQSTLADSNRWFPSLNSTQHGAATHFALGMGGEVGEVLNLIKKVNRLDFGYPEILHDLGYELADVLTYLLDLSAVLGVDLDAALAEKRAICEERWG